MKYRKGIVSEYLPWILIAVAVLVVLMIAIFILRNNGSSFIGAFNNLTGGP